MLCLPSPPAGSSWGWGAMTVGIITNYPDLISLLQDSYFIFEIHLGCPLKSGVSLCKTCFNTITIQSISASVVSRPKMITTGKTFAMQCYHTSPIHNYSTQFSNRSVGIRENSRTLLVTRVTPKLSA